LTAATEARAERVERDPAGEDDGVEDEVEGLDVVGVVAVNDERLDREDHCPDDEVEAETLSHLEREQPIHVLGEERDVVCAVDELHRRCSSRRCDAASRGHGRAHLSRLGSMRRLGSPVERRP